MIEKKIKFTSVVFDGTESFTTDFYSDSSIFFDEEQNTIRIDFTEPTDDELFIETTLIMQNDSIQILREGQISMAQNFILGEEVYGTYETDFGELSTMSITKVLEVECTEESGEIFLAYDFYLNDEWASVIQLTIEY